MASLYKKTRSPYWYAQFVDADGRRVNRSTGLRWDSLKESAEARVLIAKLEAQETANGRESGTEDGWGWVLSYLTTHTRTDKTRYIYGVRWEWLARYLVQHGIRRPCDVRYTVGADYVQWRTSLKKQSGKSVCKNTALHELKLLSQLLQEAVRRGDITLNPLAKIGINKEPAKEKPEITDAEFKKLLVAIEKEPDWLKNAFLISMHTGCRLRETRIPLWCVDLEARTITFPSPKGGKERAFSIPMPEALEPIFAAMKQDGRAHTLELPFQPSRQFQHFFRRVGMAHLCFHCLRVSYISRLARAAVPLSVAMRLVNHATETIHRIYQRLSVADLRGFSERLYQTVDPAISRTSGGKRPRARKETRARS